MSITSKTRKKLWAKSGNRCAICKKELFSKEERNEILNVGEECHIISSQKNGPRYKSGLLDYDTYDNLLLLCRNHHKEIDTLIASFPEELLMYMKANHENWVKSTLEESIENNQESDVKLLRRMTSGKELLSILSGSHAYRIDYDEPDTTKKNEYIAGVLQILTDYGDIGETLVEVSEKTKIAFELSQFLVDLELNGYFLFAEKSIETVLYDGVSYDNWGVSTLVVKKNCGSEN